MKPRVIAVVPSVFTQPGVLVFLRPDVLPGVTLYVISVDASPPSFSVPGWDIVAEFQGDQRLTVLRRVVDGSEPSLIPMITSNNMIGSSAALMLAVENADASPSSVALAGVNVPDASTTYTCPAATRSRAEDMVLGVVATNGSSALFFNPSDTVVHANVSDGQFASISLEILESLGGDVVPAKVVTLDTAQPGIAATLVIPGAAA